MKYLVLYVDPETGKWQAFRTAWFDMQNHFNANVNMIVVDLVRNLITYDGETWDDVDIDNL